MNAQTYLQVAGGRRHGGDDGGFGSSSQRVLKDSGQLGLSVDGFHRIKASKTTYTRDYKN